MNVIHRRRPDPRPHSRSLTRPSDRFEAVVLTVLIAAAMGMVALGMWVGDAVADPGSGRGPSAERGEYATTATATHDSRPVVNPMNDGYPLLWHSPIQWSSPTGELQRGVVVTNDGIEAGEAVPVVVNAQGRARMERPAPSAFAVELVVGIDTVLLGWLLLGLCWLAFESALARRRATAWTDAWERMARNWPGRSS